MVLMNLFSGQQWRLRHKEQTYGHRAGKERVGRMERVAWKHPSKIVSPNFDKFETKLCLRELKQGLCINLVE